MTRQSVDGLRFMARGNPIWLVSVPYGMVGSKSTRARCSVARAQARLAMVSTWKLSVP